MTKIYADDAVGGRKRGQQGDGCGQAAHFSIDARERRVDGAWMVGPQCSM